MAQQDAAHAVVVDPIKPDLGIGGRRVVAAQETVALQSPRSHQDEDTERSLAEGEARREALGVHADHQV